MSSSECASSASVLEFGTCRCHRLAVGMFCRPRGWRWCSGPDLWDRVATPYLVSEEPEQDKTYDAIAGVEHERLKVGRKVQAQATLTSIRGKNLSQASNHPSASRGTCPWLGGPTALLAVWLVSKDSVARARLALMLKPCRYAAQRNVSHNAGAVARLTSRVPLRSRCNWSSGEDSSITECVMLAIKGFGRCGSFVVVSIKRGTGETPSLNKAAKAAHV